MGQRDANIRIRQRPSRRSARQYVALTLTLVLLVHQVVMAMPLRTNTPMMAATNQQSNVTMPCDGACPSGIISLCIPGRVCAGVEAALTRLPFAPLMLVVLLILTVLAIRTSFVSLRHPRWLWPSDRRRALLQVFLI